MPDVVASQHGGPAPREVTCTRGPCLVLVSMVPRVSDTLWYLGITMVLTTHGTRSSWGRRCPCSATPGRICPRSSPALRSMRRAVQHSCVGYCSTPRTRASWRSRGGCVHLLVLVKEFMIGAARPMRLRSRLGSALSRCQATCKTCFSRSSATVLLSARS